MGTDGEYSHSAGKGERGPADWCSAHRLEASSGKEYGDEEETRSAARVSARGIAPIFRCSPLTSRGMHSCTIFPNEAAGESFGDPFDCPGGGGIGCRRAHC